MTASALPKLVTRIPAPAQRTTVVALALMLNEDYALNDRGLQGRFCGQREPASAERRRDSALWRRERDSNPRGLGGPCGFQDRSVQPLRHPSAWAQASLGGARHQVTQPSSLQVDPGLSTCIDERPQDGDHGLMWSRSSSSSAASWCSWSCSSGTASRVSRTRTLRSGPTGRIRTDVGPTGPGAELPPYLPTITVSDAETFRRNADRRLTRMFRRPLKGSKLDG